jgi:hypothetical protein
VNDDFGVALRTKHVAESHELGDELLKVIDFAIEGDNDAAVFVVQRLLARRNINNRQPAMTQADAGLDVIAALVWPPVMLCLVHACENFTRDVAALARVENSCNSAHFF